MSQRFTPGDHVVVTANLPAVAFGRCGTVVHLFAFLPGLYQVQLEGEHWVRVFTGSHLAPVPPERDVNQPESNAD